jgi:very-short-patch-repair endonuclease
MAAVLACGPGSALSHFTAAAHHGIRETAAIRIDVTVPGRIGRSRPGIAVHRCHGLTPGEVAEVRGIPCTTLARTVFDLAAVLRPEALEYTLHRAQLEPRSLDPCDLVALLHRFPGKAGAARLRRSLGPLIADGPDIKSALERLLARLWREARIPPPRVNAWIPLPIPAGGLEVDFCWLDRQLVVEADGRTFHGTTRATRNDAARDRALTLAGWTVVRYTWWDVTGEPGRVVAEVRALIGLRR